LLLWREAAKAKQGFFAARLAAFTTALFEEQDGELEIGVGVGRIDGDDAAIELGGGRFIADAEEVVGVVVENVGGVGRSGKGAAVRVRGGGGLSEVIEGDAEEGEGAGVVGVHAEFGAEFLFGKLEIAAAKGG
jgi:hypothetical protein